MDKELTKVADTAASLRIPGFHRPAEVARMLRCSEWWLKEQARRRRIPYAWIGGSYLFTDEHITEIIRRFEVHPVEPADLVDMQLPPARRAPAQPEDVSAVRLRARPPRRTRIASIPDSTAA